MDEKKIKTEIAKYLLGKAAPTTDSVIQSVAVKLDVDSMVIFNGINRMRDVGYILPVEPLRIRLSETGENYYFSTKKQKMFCFLKGNWTSITSNAIAIIALIVSIVSLLKK